MIDMRLSVSLSPKVPVPVAAQFKCRIKAARLLRPRVRIPPGAWTSVCFECCVLSGGRLCE